MAATGQARAQAPESSSSSSRAQSGPPMPTLQDQEGWEAEIRRVLATAPPRDAASVRQVRALLDAPRQRFGAPGDLAGAWRVRSLQGSITGIFLYPWFALSITQQGADLQFDKGTGSQRSFGMLYRAADDRLAFLGTAYIPPQGPMHHSALRPGPAPDPSRDMRGVMVRIGPRRMLLIFEPNHQGIELYEIAR